LTVTDWQREAVRVYPELGQQGSELNRLFVGEYSRLSKENAAFFSDPQWPMILARECARKLKAQSSPGPAPAGPRSSEGGKIVSYVSNGPEQVGYYVYYPTSLDPAHPPALLIMFSPQGKGEAILEAVKDACETVGWIGVGCDEFKNASNEDELDMKWREVLPDIEKRVPHDRNLMYMGGMSGGSLRAYNYSENTQRPWKGVLAMGGWLGGRTRLDCPPGMAVAMVNGEKDMGGRSWEEKDGAVLKASQCKVKAFHFPGGHQIAPPDVLTEALQWMKAETGAGS
jgi:hypothetical protein